ncbi:MAG TPA: DNA polymerase III subunit delta [Gaiella sp.]|jgi:DNA polymerase III delta subunit|nr:DNA polymerase III subunit delta [Gaiella sp.]
MAIQELKPAYLVTGNDRPKVERTLGRLRGRFDPGSIERLVAGKDGASGADVVAACNAGTLLAGARLVLVTEIDGRRGEFDRLSGGWKAADIEAVVDYLRTPAPGTVLCLVGEEVKKDSPLAKACAKVGDVLAWEVAKKEVVAWVANSFRDRGVKAGADACKTLIEIVGDDKLVLAREIDKLATWAGGEPLGSEEVQRLATPFAEGHAWDLTDAWGRRDVAAALAVVESTYARSPRPRAGEAAAFAARLGAHLTKLTRMKTLLEAGVRPRDAAAKLGMKPYPGEKLARQAEALSVEELQDATDRLARLDHAVKGGSKLAPDLELQLAVVDVARERR